MAKVIGKKQCEKCAERGEDTSGDNHIMYSDGSGYCFACKWLYLPADGYQDLKENTIPDDGKFLLGWYADLPSRGIYKDTCVFADYMLSRDKGKLCHVSNHRNQFGELISQQVRYKGKEFRWTHGMPETFFLQNKYPPNENVFVTITEGQIDALSILEAQGTRFPVLSLPGGVNSAKATIKANLEYLEKFKYVVLCFDNDKEGKETAKECADILSPGKVRIATPTRKDVNEMLCKGEKSKIKDILFSAVEPGVEYIISPSSLDKKLIQNYRVEGASIPFPKLSEKLGGFRPGGLYTFLASPKAGKTTITREIVLSMLKQDKTVYGVYLEDTKEKEARIFGSMLLGVENGIAEEKAKRDETFAKTYENAALLPEFDNKLFFFNNSVRYDLSTILKAMEIAIRSKDCDVIVFDNITRCTAGQDNRNKELEKMSVGLKELADRHQVIVINVVHKNRDGDVYGSDSISQFTTSLIELRPVEDRAPLYEFFIRLDRTKGHNNEVADQYIYNRNTGRINTIENVEEKVLS